MPSGLIALLDDVVGITKIAAASIDDVGAVAGRASAKAMGVVVDDAAVTPRYVTDFKPERELPIILRIARGSLFNKLVILLPIALLLSAFAPWAITPLLMIGGAFLCFEGAEKVIDAWRGGHAEQDVPAFMEPTEAEEAKIKGAIRTDFILSAEIMAIALAEVAQDSLAMQAAALAVVAIGITALVYGVVGMIVKMDDVGLVLAQRQNGFARKLGRGLVLGMPKVMATLSIVGIAAMLWVGGQIIVHGLEALHIPEPAHSFHAWAHALAIGGADSVVAAIIEWVANAAFAGVFGLILGIVIAWLVHVIAGLRRAAPA